MARQAQGTWLAQACGLGPAESFNEDDLYGAMDQLNGQWVSLEKQLYQRAFAQAVRLVLYDLTSVYFEGKGPEHLANLLDNDLWLWTRKADRVKWPP